MRTHCPACKKAIPPNIDACPFCPMSFEELEKKPKAEVAGAGPAVAMVLIFGMMGLFLMSHQGDEKKDETAAKESAEKPPEPEVEVNVHNQPPPLGLQTELTKSRMQEASSGGPRQTGPLPDPEKGRLGQVEAPQQPSEAGGVWGALPRGGSDAGGERGGGGAGGGGGAAASMSAGAPPAPGAAPKPGPDSGVYGPLNRPSAAQASADREASIREARRGRDAAAEESQAPPGPAAEAPAVRSPRAAPAEEEPRASASQAAADRRVSRQESGASVPSAGPAEEDAREWRFRGTVYALDSLGGVAGMAVVFTDHESNARYEVATDSSGRYRTILPALPDRGYDVLLAHPRYHPAFLMGTLRRYKAVSPGKRRELALGLVGAVEKKGSLFPEGAAPLVTDFFVAPRSLR